MGAASLRSLTDGYTQDRDCGDRAHPEHRADFSRKAGLATPANVPRLSRTRYFGLTSGLPRGAQAAVSPAH